MLFIDFHCDTLYELPRYQARLYDNGLCVSVKKLRSAGVICQFFAAFINMADHRSVDEGWQQAARMHSLFRFELAANADSLLWAKSAADIEAAARQGKTAAVLTVEEGGICGESLERLEKLYEMGVRLITLTWNHENAIGYPHSADAADMRRGLKPFGVEFIEKMNRLGMIIDVSHLSEGGFWDVVKHSTKPFVASHSNARAIREVSRNLTDEQLKALAQKGGVCGINFYPHFLGDDGTGSTAQMVSHIRHIKKVAGIDCIAIGSDFDGFSGSAEIKDSSGLPLLAEALQNGGFTYDEIEKICWRNALRVIKDVL